MYFLLKEWLYFHTCPLPPPFYSKYYMKTQSSLCWDANFCCGLFSNAVDVLLLMMLFWENKNQINHIESWQYIVKTPILLYCNPLLKLFLNQIGLKFPWVYFKKIFIKLYSDVGADSKSVWDTLKFWIQKFSC